MPKKLRWTLVMVALVAAILAVLSGCGGIVSGGTIAGISEAEMMARSYCFTVYDPFGDDKVMQQLIGEFCTEHADIGILYRGYNDKALYQEDLNALLQTGSTGNCVYFAQNTKYRVNTGSTGLENNYNEAADSMASRLNIYGDAIPIMGSGYCMLGNAQVLAENGIEEMPETYNQLRNAIWTLTESETPIFLSSDIKPNAATLFAFADISGRTNSRNLSVKNGQVYIGSSQALDVLEASFERLSYYTDAGAGFSVLSGSSYASKSFASGAAAFLLTDTATALDLFYSEAGDDCLVGGYPVHTRRSAMAIEDVWSLCCVKEEYQLPDGTPYDPVQMFINYLLQSENAARLAHGQGMVSFYGGGQLDEMLQNGRYFMTSGKSNQLVVSTIEKYAEQVANRSATYTTAARSAAKALQEVAEDSGD